MSLLAMMMLGCAVVASLGAGVLLAHGICVGMFRVFRMHALQVAAKAPGRRAARLRVAGS